MQREVVECHDVTSRPRTEEERMRKIEKVGMKSEGAVCYDVTSSPSTAEL